MKRFLVAIPTQDGGVELHAMKEWLRRHPNTVPAGLDATSSTSHRLRDGLKSQGWLVKESDSEVRLIRPEDGEWREVVDAVLGPSDEDDADSMGSDGALAFGLEYQLRDFLAQNLSNVNADGARLQLYVDPTGREGIEYPTAVGPIDILAVDEHGGFVVFELKRARTADRALGQLARYMGWVKHTIGRAAAVRGVIVAKSIDQRLKFGATVIPGVSLFEYAVQFTLQPVGLTTGHAGSD
jgi:endonuclease